jgi:MFS family permease
MLELCRKRWQKYQALNSNVRLTLWWTWVETASSSIRSGDVLSAFIYLRTGDNSTVGYIQGVNGAMQLLLAVPAGWLADRYRRDAVLRGAAAVGAFAAAVYCWVLFTDAPVIMLYVALGLIGGYRGFNNPAVESIFADSVATGQSSALYTAKQVVINLSSTCGPAISIVLFLCLGNTWEAGTCRVVLLAGLVAMLLPLALMCFFDDDKTLGLLSESLQETASYQSLGEAERGAPSKGPWSPFGAYTVPALVSFSDLISALASGMTIKFFSLFFFEVVGLGPVYVSTISLLMPLGISLLALILQSMTQCFDRMHLTIVTRTADVALLVAMAYMPTDSRAAGHALVAAHLLRSSFANASRPLLRSVLMDNVPKRLRARFNALESVKSFGWSGSAAAGGVLISTVGFQHTFIITAIVKLVALVALLPLLGLVDDNRRRDETGCITNTSNADNSLPVSHAPPQPPQLQPLLADDGNAAKPSDIG